MPPIDVNGNRRKPNSDVSGVHLLLNFPEEELEKMSVFKMKDIFSFNVATAIISVLCVEISHARLQYDFVTCGSVTKLINTRLGVRLHSHDVKYGSGSGQQSVTAVDSADDANSYWRISGQAEGSCVRGRPVQCGQTVKLTHVNTGRNLHSHHFTSPLSQNFEVSAFGEGGSGDDGDFWIVTCSGNSWRRDDKIRLKHVVTDRFLHITGDTYGRPINGQREVSGYPSPNELNFWKAAEGVFIKPVEMMTFHDEL